MESHKKKSLKPPTRPAKLGVFPLMEASRFHHRKSTVGDSQGPWRGIPPIVSVQWGKGMEKVWFGHAK
jgi:hypothetical protein